MHTHLVFSIVSTVLCIKVTYPKKKKGDDKSVVTSIFIQREGME